MNPQKDNVVQGLAQNISRIEKSIQKLGEHQRQLSLQFQTMDSMLFAVVHNLEELKTSKKITKKGIEDTRKKINDMYENVQAFYKAAKEEHEKEAENEKAKILKK